VNEGLSRLLQTPQFSQFLDKTVYKKLKTLCIQNQIDIETFTVELLKLALNHHGKEIQEIIKNLKR